jgi:hypothetical protein
MRPNRDTLYSMSVFDFDPGPVTITLLDAGKRFMSLQVIDGDQYTHLLEELDSVLARFDELTDKVAIFPAELATIEAKHKTLTDQELDSIEAIEARSAQMSKIAAMRELATSRPKKLKAAVAAQQELAIKIGTRIADNLEQRWWANYTKRADEIGAKFDELFYRSALDQNLQDAYRPITLLQWLRPPDFRTSRFSPADGKIVKCRGLRKAANKLAEFERMSFGQIAERLEALTRR